MRSPFDWQLAGPPLILLQRTDRCHKEAFIPALTRTHTAASGQPAHTKDVDPREGSVTLTSSLHHTGPHFVILKAEKVSRNVEWVLA